MSSPELNEYQRTHERDRFRLLLEAINALISHLELRGLFVEISNCLRRLQHQMTALQRAVEELPKNPLPATH